MLPTLKTADEIPVGVPSLVANIVRELWTRAIAQTEEVAALRGEIDWRRDSLEREQQLVVELRPGRRSQNDTESAKTRSSVAE